MSNKLFYVLIVILFNSCNKDCDDLSHQILNDKGEVVYLPYRWKIPLNEDSNPLSHSPSVVGNNVVDDDKFLILTNKNSTSRYLTLISSSPDASPPIWTIPVIVHIIYDPSLPANDPTYPTDALIVSGIDWINNLLEGNAACPNDPPSVETGIRLCLASRDIYGTPSNGINRFPHALTDMDLCRDELTLKNIPRISSDPFPNTDYLNIYLVREICASCKPLDCLVGGFAAYPAAHGTLYDGIVLESFTWMNFDCNVRKVILHEIGHYFNLRHTWEGSCINDDCLKDGDKVADTPPDNDENFYPSNPCFQGLPINSCFNDVNPGDPNNPFLTDQFDMTSNLMDYAPTACISQFTAGQVTRMIETLEGPRRSLLISKGCETPCSVPVILDIQWPASPILFNTPIMINNNPQGSVTYQWTYLNNITNSITYLFPADSIGIFEICVDAISAISGCNQHECRLVEVVCTSTDPTFIISNAILDLGETLELTQTSVSQPGFVESWFMNGQMVGQGSIFDFTPPEAGSYVAWLESCNSECCIESTHQYFSVGHCPTGKEANHWLFGRDSVHLDWNTGIPIEKPPSSAFSDEAMAVAVDANGQLLFYSDDWKVYNRNHQRMPNGQLPGINISATHCLTVPQPGSDSLWYLFYPEQINSSNLAKDTTTKLFMAVIDMSLENGLGDVIMKDVILLEPSTEKVAAIRHCNGIDWWIVGHEAGSNRFFSWLLTKAGLSPPTISSSGVAKSKRRFPKGGELNISPDGLKLAMSTGPDLFYETIPYTTIELFDFDPVSGIVSNDILIGTYPLGGGKSPYGLEFSPSSELLYIAYQTSIDTLMQFDIRSGDQNLIQNSRQDIFISSSGLENQFGAMLTGPDGKIYIANPSYPFLSVIQDPDIIGPGCNFSSHGIDLQRGECFVGLPTFPGDIYRPGFPSLKGPYTLCDTMSEAKFFVAGNCRYQDYEWKLNGSSEMLRFDKDTVWIRPGSSGVDQLIVTKYSACGFKSDTFEINIESCDVNPSSCTIDFTWSEADTVVCAGEDAWLSFYTNAETIQYSLGSDGLKKSLQSSTLVIPKPSLEDRVTLYLTDSIGCDTQITITIRVNPPLDIHIIDIDSIVCEGQSASINLQTPISHLVEIFPSNLGYVITNPSWPLSIGPLYSDTTIYVRIRNSVLSCDSVYIWHIRTEQEEISSYDTIYFCYGDSVDIEGIWFHQDSVFIESFAREGCDSLHQINITSLLPLKIDYTISEPCQSDNGIITITPLSGLHPFTYFINGDPSPADSIFEGLPAGPYIIGITDANGCHKDTLIHLEQSNILSGITATTQDAYCDTENGRIIMTSTHPDILYSFNSGPFRSDSVFNDLQSGSHQIIALNYTGCRDTINVLIDQMGSPYPGNLLISSSHCNQFDGMFSIPSITGGKAPFLIQLGSGLPDTVTHFENLSVGNYSYTIVDANGCLFTGELGIENLPGPLLKDIKVSPALCGQLAGSIEVNAVEPDGLLYSIDNSTLSDHNIFTALMPGIYTIQVTDEFDCQVTQEVFVPDSFSYAVTAIEVLPSNCGNNNGQINFHISSSTIDITVLELQGEIFHDKIESLAAGNYHIQLKDSLNCIIDTIIIVPLSCDIYLPNVFSPNGDGINDLFGQVSNIPFDKWELSIYDRSGNMVYSTTNPLKGWNGNFKNKNVQSGVYAWSLRYKLSAESNMSYKYGDVTLIK